LVSPAATTDDVSDGAGSGLSGGEVTSVNVSLENVNSVDPVSIDMRDASDGSGETNDSRSELRNVLADGLDILIRHSGDYNLRVTSRDIDVVAASVDTDSNTPDLSTDALNGEGKRFFQVTTQRPVGVITVDHDIKPSFVETATHKFRVRKTYLDATGGSADSVRLYRDTGETYQQLPTRLVDEDDKYHHFEAVSPGFSTFVIGTAAPVFSFEDAALDAADEATGAVEASVSVTNIGQEGGTAAVVLAADDATLGTAEAAVSAGETVVVTADGVVEATTTVALSIADQPLGPFTRDSTTDGEPTDDSQSADGDGGGNANDQAFADPGAGSMLVIVFMTAIVGGLFLFLLWRQRGRDKDEVRRKGGEPQ
jgi:PGF-pre-PGF domain-containing protein